MAKLSTSERHARLREKLEEQRHLLRKSIDELAAGDLAEALHVSAILRLLVHESASSKPLLKQLTSNYLELPVPDLPPPPEEELPPGIQKAVVLSVPVSVRFSTDGGGVFLNPELSGHIDVPLGTWWERPSLVIPGSGGYSRREVVLGLANKEGGTHVDLEVTRKYQQLLDYKALIIQFTPLNLSRMMVGQAGVEMLECLNRSFQPTTAAAEARA
jgi:hypothetical protein